MNNMTKNISGLALIAALGVYSLNSSADATNYQRQAYSSKSKKFPEDTVTQNYHHLHQGMPCEENPTGELIEETPPQTEILDVTNNACSVLTVAHRDPVTSLFINMYKTNRRNNPNNITSYSIKAQDPIGTYTVTVDLQRRVYEADYGTLTITEGDEVTKYLVDVFLNDAKIVKVDDRWLDNRYVDDRLEAIDVSRSLGEFYDATFDYCKSQEAQK